jgi:REP element-mobilizing transposase RayT
MSNVHRLRTSDRIFFITSNLGLAERTFEEPEYPIILDTIAKSRERLGFLLCGYVLMPDHWHGLIWPQYPVTISDVLQDIKRVSSLRINQRRRTRGSLWQHQFWDRFVRHAKGLLNNNIYKMMSFRYFLSHARLCGHGFEDGNIGCRTAVVASVEHPQ